MDMHYPAADRLRLVTGHVRLLADLLLAGPDLKDVDRGAFAQVLQDLAARLEQVCDETEPCRDCPHLPTAGRP